MLNYAELELVFAQAANIVNDRPIRIRGLSEDVYSALTLNQLLLGRTSSAFKPTNEDEEVEKRKLPSALLGRLAYITEDSTCGGSSG